MSCSSALGQGQTLMRIQSELTVNNACYRQDALTDFICIADQQRELMSPAGQLSPDTQQVQVMRTRSWGANTKDDAASALCDALKSTTNIMT